MVSKSLLNFRRRIYEAFMHLAQSLFVEPNRYQRMQEREIIASVATDADEAAIAVLHARCAECGNEELVLFLNEGSSFLCCSECLKLFSAEQVFNERKVLLDKTMILLLCEERYEHAVALWNSLSRWINDSLAYDIFVCCHELRDIRNGRSFGSAVGKIGMKMKAQLMSSAGDDGSGAYFVLYVWLYAAAFYKRSCYLVESCDRVLLDAMCLLQERKSEIEITSRLDKAESICSALEKSVIEEENFYESVKEVLDFFDAHNLSIDDNARSVLESVLQQYPCYLSPIHDLLNDFFAQSESFKS